MAAVEVTISGMLYDRLNRTTQNVVLIGEASLTGVGVGGGPIQPPAGGGQPPGGGQPGAPTHPIWGPPGSNFPDKPGYPPVAGHPLPIRPEHPIQPPDGQPPSGGGGQPGTPTFPIWGPPGIELPPGSGYPPVAGHPLPPEGEKPQPIVGWEAKAFWTPDTGWAVAIVPKEGTEVPTPS